MFKGQKKKVSKGKNTVVRSADWGQWMSRHYRQGEEVPLPAFETALKFPENITKQRSRKGYDLHLEYRCMNGAWQWNFMPLSSAKDFWMPKVGTVWGELNRHLMMLEDEQLHHPKKDADVLIAMNTAKIEPDKTWIFPKRIWENRIFFF